MSDPFSDFTPVDYVYYIYGKYVRSNFPIPLSPCKAPGHHASASQLYPEIDTGSPLSPDITAFFEGYVPKRLDYNPDPWSGREWYCENDLWYLRYYMPDGKEITFRFSADGRQIHFTHSWLHWNDALFALVNPVMAISASLQGRLSLHASSLVYKGYSFCFMGNSGAGKSTLSTALALEGMAVHSDDIAFPAWRNSTPDGSTGAPLVPAGYPMIKVLPDIPKKLGLTHVTPIRIFSDDTEQDEHWIHADELPGKSVPAPAPLGGIFILGERKSGLEAPLVEKLTPMPAVLALTEHVYGAQWINKPGPEVMSLCTKIAVSVPVFRVTLPDNISLLRQCAGILLHTHITALVSESEPSPVGTL